MDIIGIIGIILGNELQAYYDFISDASYAESVIVHYRMYQHRKYMYDFSFWLVFLNITTSLRYLKESFPR